MARMSGQKLGTYSVSGNNTYTRNDNYAYGASYTVMPQDGLWLYNVIQTGTAVAERITLANLENMKSFWKSSGKAIGESVSEIIDENFNGSLPAFVAAFAKRRNLSEEEITELKELIEKMGG